METSLVVTGLLVCFLSGLLCGNCFISACYELAIIRRVLTKKSFDDAVKEFDLVRYSEILLADQMKKEKQDL